MAESTIERTVSGLAEKAGWFQRKLKWIGRNGAPDRFYARPVEPCPVCGCGARVVLIEYKAPGKAAQEHQSLEHLRLREAGVEIYLCDNIPAGKKILGL